MKLGYNQLEVEYIRSIRNRYLSNLKSMTLIHYCLSVMVRLLYYECSNESSRKPM